MKNNLNENSQRLPVKKIDWKIIQSEMKNKFGNDIYESWLRKIDFVEEFNNYILISVSTRFIRDWIVSRYLDQILQIIKIYKKEISRIEFSIHEKQLDSINIKDLEYNNDKEKTNKNISFIKDSFLQYNRIDPNKIFVWGSSAGAMIGLHLAVSEEDERPASTYGSFGDPDLGCIDCEGNNFNHF